MTRRVTWAANQIAKLATDADSQSVQLAALRAIFSNMMAVSEFARLEERMTQIEEQLRGQDGNSAHTGSGHTWPPPRPRVPNPAPVESKPTE
jgi:hypothetical protein